MRAIVATPDGAPSRAEQLVLGLLSPAQRAQLLKEEASFKVEAVQLKVNGQPTEKLVASHLKYCRTMREEGYERSGAWREGTWSYLMGEVMMQAALLTGDPAEKAKFVDAAKAAFHALDGNVAADGAAPFNTSKSTTMLLQGGGLYMLHAAKEGKEVAGKP